MKLLAAVACWCAVTSISNFSQAQERVYFRHDFGVPKDDQPLPNNFTDDAQLLWKTELLPGHSSPCICGDAIYLTTFDKEAKQLATVAINRQSGEISWKQTVPTQDIETVHATGSPATPTPACNGKQVFSFFGSYGMLCYDTQGKLLWEKRMGPFQDEFGAASSPILVDDKVIINQDHDIDSFITALKQSDGETVWKTPREEATRSYSTPLIIERDGSKQVLIAGSLQLNAYDVSTGEKLWWFNGLSRIVDSTPVLHNGLIYLATWTPGGDPGERISMESFGEALSKYDKNSDKTVSPDELPEGSPVLERFFRIDLNQNKQLDEDEWKRHASVFERAQNIAVALEPGTRGALSPQYVRWSNDRGLPIVPSSVVYRGVMTMVKDSGIVTTLDAETGKQLQQLRAEGRGNYYASLVAGDDKIYAISESGVITVLQAGKTTKVLAKHDLAERVMASPVIRDGVIFVRTEAGLYAFTKKR